MIAGVSGIYEVLLIVLVIVLIFNGLLRNKILRNTTEQQSSNHTEKHSKSTNTIKKGEYVDFEVVSENLTKKHGN